MHTRMLLAMASMAGAVLAAAFLASQSFARPMEVQGAADREIREVEASIDRIESESLQRAGASSLDRDDKFVLLGKLILFDRTLSVDSNEACAFCHMPEAGFTGAVSALNATTVSYPGSIRTRFSNRRPQSIAYASYAPVLHYNALQGDYVGGAFWDMRAAGVHFNSPTAEQAQAPPVNPVEMGLDDSACMVFRLSKGAYRRFAEELWGKAAFAIAWPADTVQVCSQPGGSGANSIPLDAVARKAANGTFDRIAEALAAYDASSEVNAFSSKFDYVMAGKARFTAAEKAGYKLFRSTRTHCNECHRDGGPGEEPLFTDFTASNLGVPANRAIPFYSESEADRFGYAANPVGGAYVDPGVGGFLTAWLKTPADAAKFRGKFQVPTVRNVDKRPGPDFVKAYMHNGYFKSLKEVVHFYNTRDVLPRCQAGDPGEKVTCWPVPEYAATMNRKQLVNLGLTSAQEGQLVAFLKTLSDGYAPAEVSRHSKKAPTLPAVAAPPASSASR